MNSFSGMNSGSLTNSRDSQRNAFMNPLHAYDSLKNDPNSSKESKEAPQTKNEEEKLIEQENLTSRDHIERHPNAEYGYTTLKERKSENIAHKEQDHSLYKENQIEKGRAPDSSLAGDHQQQLCKQKAEKGSLECFQVLGIQDSYEKNELKDYVPGHIGTYPLAEIAPSLNLNEERKENKPAPLHQKEDLNGMDQGFSSNKSLFMPMNVNLETGIQIPIANNAPSMQNPKDGANSNHNVALVPHGGANAEEKKLIASDAINGFIEFGDKLEEVHRSFQEKIPDKTVTEADITTFNSVEAEKRKESPQDIENFENEINDIRSFHSSKRLSSDRISPIQYSEELKNDQEVNQQSYRTDSDEENLFKDKNNGESQIKFIDTEQGSGDLQGFNEQNFHSFHNANFGIVKPKGSSSQGNANIMLDLIKTKTAYNQLDEASPEKVNKVHIQEVDWDDFIELEELGKGTYGEVWRWFSKTSRQFFAMKKAKHADALAKREYEILERLMKINNKKLLQIIKLEYVPDVKFFAVMEYGSGTLKDFAIFLKSQNRTWTDEDLVNLYYQLEDQVRELREMRLCHRDIKPANVIISSEGKFKLADFGLAQVVAKDGEQWMTTAGTEGFCAPEVDEAIKLGKPQCWSDPFQADMISVEKTIDYIIQRDEWRKNIPIRELIKSYPRPAILNKLNLYTNLKEEFSCSIFDKLYKERELPKKYEMMRVFINYYYIDEVAEWLKRKFKEPKTDGENVQFYFLIGEVFRRHGRYTQARNFYMKILHIKPEPDNKMALLISGALESMEQESLFAPIPGMEKNREIVKFAATVIHISRLASIKQAFGENSLQLAEEYSSFGQKHFCSGYKNEALKLFEKADALLNKINPNAVSQVHHQLASAKGEHDLAIDLHQIYIHSLKKEYGKDHPTIGFELVKLGRTYNIIKQPSKARKCYKEALQTLRNTFSDDHIEIGKVYQDYGDSYLFEDMAKAKHFYKLNLEICYKIQCTENGIIKLDFKKIKSVIENSAIDNFDQWYLVNCLRGPENIQAEDHYFIKDFWKNSGLEFGDAGKLSLSNKNTRLETIKSLALKPPNFILSLLEIACIYDLQRRFIELGELTRIVSDLSLYKNLQIFFTSLGPQISSNSQSF